jgi:hypothetical protein
MKKAISTDLTTSNITQVIDLLAGVPDRLESLSSLFPDGGHTKPLGSGERTFTEDLAHMVNVEARSSEAIFLALLADEPEIHNIHAERQYGKLLRHDLLTHHELLTYFRVRRTTLMRVLRSLKVKDWSRTLREPGKQRRESVYWRTRGLAMHELDHLTDLEKKLG